MENKRLFELDFLRGIAILFVLSRHFHTLDEKIHVPLFYYAGWAGVDLFFVLSGFLISTLIYKEYDKTGGFKAKRFLIRRGFKIYPSFYLMIFSIIIIQFITQKLDYSKIISELFFLQSYKVGLLNHTWSLAVEEHFYFLFTLIIIIMIRNVKDNTNKLKYIPAFYIFVAIFCLSIRIYNYYKYPTFDIYRNYFNSHIRIDSLFLGVFLSYMYRYKNYIISYVYIKYRSVILLLSLSGVSIIFFFQGEANKFINTIGFTILALSFGNLMLLLIVNTESKLVVFIKNNNLTKTIAHIGFYSYSIYLWHMHVEAIFSKNKLYYNYNFWVIFLFYLLLCYVIGRFFAKIIEFPMIKIRDKFFA
jgi:peptidoglycan/LPS O-acetylase OafA/YrhL